MAENAAIPTSYGHMLRVQGDDMQHCWIFIEGGFYSGVTTEIKTHRHDDTTTVVHGITAGLRPNAESVQLLRNQLTDWLVNNGHEKPRDAV
jgi:hypothetical protein